MEWIYYGHKKWIKRKTLLLKVLKNQLLSHLWAPTEKAHSASSFALVLLGRCPSLPYFKSSTHFWLHLDVLNRIICCGWGSKTPKSSRKWFVLRWCHYGINCRVPNGTTTAAQHCVRGDFWGESRVYYCVWLTKSPLSQCWDPCHSRAW